MMMNTMGWELGKSDIEAVTCLAREGLNREEIARTLGMSVHMVACAQQKAARAPRTFNLNLLGLR